MSSALLWTAVLIAELAWASTAVTPYGPGAALPGTDMHPLQDLATRAHPYASQSPGFDPFVDAWQLSAGESCASEYRPAGTFCHISGYNDGVPLQQHYWRLCIHVSTLTALQVNLALDDAAATTTSSSNVGDRGWWDNLAVSAYSNHGSCPQDHYCVGHGPWFDQPPPVPPPPTRRFTVQQLVTLARAPLASIMCVPRNAPMLSGSKRGRHGDADDEMDWQDERGRDHGGDDKRRRHDTSTSSWSGVTSLTLYGGSEFPRS